MTDIPSDGYEWAEKLINLARKDDLSSREILQCTTLFVQTAGRDDIRKALGALLFALKTGRP
ncbi:TPA: hypothetical protein U6I48_003870 [Klebsiella aerogenes]|nr:hypothetical protein [Klebsiella aerogenes]